MLEYIDSKHIYLKDGVILPSVTQILQKIFPDKYKGIPEYILSNKAIYGSMVHKAIQDYNESNGIIPKTNNLYVDIAVAQYQDLEKEYHIEMIEQEKMICYEDKFAGRYDLRALINNQQCLCDIKTTAELDEKYLSWQLSLYELATGIKFDKLYAIWLPKKAEAKLIEIKRIDREILLKKLEEIL